MPEPGPDLKYVVAGIDRLRGVARAVPEIAAILAHAESSAGQPAADRHAEHERLVALAHARFPLLADAAFGDLPGNQQFVRAMSREPGGAWALVGFAGLQKRWKFPDVSRKLMDEMTRRGNWLYSHTYDTLTYVSVSPGFQGRGLSRALCRAAVDLAVQRHAARGGQGPALVRLSKFEPMGRERLLRELTSIASERQGELVLGFSRQDSAELGDYFEPMPGADCQPREEISPAAPGPR